MQTLGRNRYNEVYKSDQYTTCRCPFLNDGQAVCDMIPIPDPTTVMRVPTLAPTTVGRVPTPAPTTVGRVPTASPTTVGRVPTPVAPSHV
jgi:hypothetical protein